MTMAIYEKLTIGDRTFVVYERRQGSRAIWEVWERTQGRGTRVFGPGSRKRCYEYLRGIEGERTYA
jgi:hypothetical protein